MAKSRKTTDEEKENMLEVPAGAAIAGEAPIRQAWPVTTETRELTTKLSDAGRIVVVLDYFKQQGEVESLEREKKSAAKNFDNRISEAEKVMNDLAESVKTGSNRRAVHCRWAYETNGLDGEGNPIYHSELKTLFREDTGEVVEVNKITTEDRQVNLPLSDEEQLEANRKLIEAAGYTLEEAPADSFWTFVLTGPDGVPEGVSADSMASAAAVAVGMLPASSATEETAEEPDAE